MKTLWLIILAALALCLGCDISTQHVFATYQGTIAHQEWNIEFHDPWLRNDVAPGEAHADTTMFYIRVERKSGEGFDVETAGTEVVDIAGRRVVLSELSVRLADVVVEVAGHGRVAALDTVGAKPGEGRRLPDRAWVYRVLTPRIALPAGAAELDLSAVVEWIDAGGEVLMRHPFRVRYLHVCDRYPEMLSK